MPIDRPGHTDIIRHVDTEPTPHTDTSTAHSDIPAVHTDTPKHDDVRVHSDLHSDFGVQP